MDGWIDREREKENKRERQIYNVYMYNIFHYYIVCYSLWGDTIVKHPFIYFGQYPLKISQVRCPFCVRDITS